MAVGCMVAGLLIAGLAVWWWRRETALHARAKATWHEVPGVLEQAWVTEHRERAADGDTAISYRANVCYRYTALGQERTGDRPFLTTRANFNSYQAAQRWLDALGQRQPLPVWFDPAAADRSALELNRPSIVMPLVLVPLGLGLLGFGIAVAAKGG